MTSENDIVRPRALVVPTTTPLLQDHAEVGTLIMSGAKMYVAVTVGNFELVTSA